MSFSPCSLSSATSPTLSSLLTSLNCAGAPRQPPNPALPRPLSPSPTRSTASSINFEKALRNVLKRLDESDIKRRQLGVMFEDSHVVSVGAAASYHHTLRSFLNPLGFVHNIRAALHWATIDNGVVRPGEMHRVPPAECRGDVQYCPEDNAHFPTITADQTLRFAATTRTA
ncbi:hypothetical protein C8Q70DRAFT_1059497 [Cubamyces menziesii]|uniref:Pleiotropic ABC efflux transporter N-terminal domain-containing protein n=1 Tax=Trametes cubensis TaxID=1111947 RepID=A0AAD7TK26_9APHY|nr:hypothetical protein C8Q70DRAFT_1059497 [Cubamyces menziesii]KAJ8457295.1 hypothetical protein ONZ51_g11620 [Trametes cubensis]